MTRTVRCQKFIQIEEERLHIKFQKSNKKCASGAKNVVHFKIAIQVKQKNSEIIYQAICKLRKINPHLAPSIFCSELERLLSLLKGVSLYCSKSDTKVTQITPST